MSATYGLHSSQWTGSCLFGIQLATRSAHPSRLSSCVFHSVHTMAAPSGSGITTAQKVGRMAKWWFRVRDMPETLVLYGLVGGVFGAAMYSTKRVLLNNEAGAYWDIQMRGNPELQTEAGRTGFEDPASGKRSMWYHIAQWKVDENGANIGVLWDNRTRPHQYSKPGEAGLGAGLSSM